MSINIEHLNIKDSNFHDRAAVVYTENHAEPNKDEAILRELQHVREQLANTEPMIADAVDVLEQAVKAQDKPKISESLRKFSSETVKAVMKTVASKALLAWMGIS